MERIKELIEGYSLEYGRIWLFFNALPDNGLVEKEKQAKGGKKLKQQLTVAFFVNAAGEKVDQPIVIWKSKLPRYFMKLQDPSRPANVQQKRFNRKFVFENRKVILFLNNATCHVESMFG